MVEILNNEDIGHFKMERAGLIQQLNYFPILLMWVKINFVTYSRLLYSLFSSLALGSK